MIPSGSFSGRFDIRVYDANTGRLTKSRSFPNLITNQGLASYCGAAPSFFSSRICVGDGTATPAVTDTQLNHFIASSDTELGGGIFNGGHGNNGAPDYISWTKGTARFNAGRFNGTTITEVGVTNWNADSPVFSRALILDEHGNPSSVVILANEYFDVTYTLFYHPDLTDTQFSFEMNGVTYNCVARACSVAQSAFANSGNTSPLVAGVLSVYLVTNSQTLGDITGVPIYGPGGAIDFQGRNGAMVPYSTDTPYTHRSNVLLGLTDGNFEGGIGSMTMGPNLYYPGGITSYTQVSFTPKLPKDANTEITLTLAKTVSRYVAPTP